MFRTAALLQRQSNKGKGCVSQPRAVRKGLHDGFDEGECKHSDSQPSPLPNSSLLLLKYVMAHSGYRLIGLYSSSNFETEVHNVYIRFYTSEKGDRQVIPE